MNRFVLLSQVRAEEVAKPYQNTVNILDFSRKIVNRNKIAIKRFKF